MTPRSVVSFLLVLGLAPAGVCAAAVPATLPPDALRPGQHAVVHTVFHGDSVETFDAEIVGVLRGGRVDGDMILARATTERVVQSGVAQGMSGSPVYVDGRLIGALSSGWPFSREPIFGITPIGDMLKVFDQPDGSDPGAAGPAGTEGSAGGDARVRFGPFRWSGAPLDSVAPPAPDPLRPRPLALPLAVSGLDPVMEPVVRDALAPLGLAVTPAGQRVERGSAGDLVPGAACAVDVLRGDLNFSAIGTVTYRDGDRVLLFGHPFFGSGAVRLPLSTAEIVTILPSLANSFKLGSPGRTVGTATQDRRSAVAGRIGGRPRMLPVSVSVRQDSGPVQSFHFETIEDRLLMPQLLAAAIGNSVAESGGNNATQTVRWRLVVHRRGGAPLEMHDVQASDTPAPDAYGAILAPLRFLVNNPFERLAMDSVEVEITTQPGRALWTLRGASLLAPEVAPGGRLRVRCELDRWRGARETVDLEIPVPEELPPGRYVLALAGGSEFTRGEATRLPARFRPVSLDDAFERLGGLRPADALCAGLWARAPEVTRDGEDLPELPASALPLVAPDLVAGEGAERATWALVQEVRRAFPGVVRGDLSLNVTVARSAP